MTELFLPSHFVANRERPYGPFDRDFFAEKFNTGEAPHCELFAAGEVPVVEIELVNGETCDVFAFEAFEEDHLVAQLFDDPPSCERFYLSFVRYESIFRVNVRYYEPRERSLGFRPMRLELPPSEAEPDAADQDAADQGAGAGADAPA